MTTFNWKCLYYAKSTFFLVFKYMLIIHACISTTSPLLTLACWMSVRYDQHAQKMKNADEHFHFTSSSSGPRSCFSPWVACVSRTGLSSFFACRQPVSTQLWLKLNTAPNQHRRRLHLVRWDPTFVCNAVPLYPCCGLLRSSQSAWHLRLSRGQLKNWFQFRY